MEDISKEIKPSITLKALGTRKTIKLSLSLTKADANITWGKYFIFFCRYDYVSWIFMNLYNERQMACHFIYHGRHFSKQTENRLFSHWCHLNSRGAVSCSSVGCVSWCLCLSKVILKTTLKVEVFIKNHDYYSAGNFVTWIQGRLFNK